MESLNNYSTVGSFHSTDKTFNNKGYYLTMEVKITSSNLWLSNYTDYQMELYSIISDLYDNKNKTFKEISDYLNDNGYKTPRNKVFTHKHTWSIYTKKKRSDKRFGRLYQPDIVNVGLDIINHSPYWYITPSGEGLPIRPPLYMVNKGVFWVIDVIHDFFPGIFFIPNERSTSFYQL